MRKIFYNQAIAEALREEMHRDDSVVLWGLDVGAYGGANAATKGLFEEFGPERVIDMPISELGYVGMGVGAAATGLRPVVELQFSDWITLASEMLVNQGAKMRYMFGGIMSVPMVLRAPIGGYLQAGAQHSNCFEAWFMHVPGIKVIVPSTPYDVKGMLKSAIRDNNIVICFEHKKLYGVKGEVSDEDYTIPLGQAEVKREGSDVSLVTYAYMTHLSLEASSILADEGIDVEVIDLRSVDPLDEITILKSVEKTHRLVIIQEPWRKASVSSEISAIVADKAFFHLDAPIKRVTMKDTPVPFSPVLENFILPQVDDIVQTVKSVMA